MMFKPKKIEKIEKILLATRSPPYVLDQIRHAIYKLGVTDYMQITNISKSLRTRLKAKLGQVLSLERASEKKDTQVHKVLLQVKGEERLETVRMEFKQGGKSFHSLCISTQCGCAMGCRFCATGAIGLRKDLTSEEICDQVLYFQSQGLDIDNISFMGMGEPFANSENVFYSLAVLTDPLLFNISPRRVSISTVGIIPGIQRLTKEFPQVNLAFSLHTPFGGQRRELMPIAKSYPIDEVMAVLDEHIIKTRRRVFIAYILLQEVNDSLDHAKALTDLIKSRGKHSYLYHVNLIQYNSSPVVRGFKRSRPKQVEKFTRVLRDRNLSFSWRQSFGRNIGGACGQLVGRAGRLKRLSRFNRTK